VQLEWKDGTGCGVVDLCVMHIAGCIVTRQRNNAAQFLRLSDGINSCSVDQPAL